VSQAQRTLARAADRRPRPQPDDATRFYWEAAADHRLVLQRCRSCQRLQFPPDVCCVHCGAGSFDPVGVSGRGTIYSWAVVDRALHAGFVDALPYVVALIELVEQPGLRILANVIGTSPGELACGLPVEVTFEQRGDVTLPQFRVAGAGAS
jgi:uncharacterized OB-fold protein